MSIYLYIYMDISLYLNKYIYIWIYIYIYIYIYYLYLYIWYQLYSYYITLASLVNLMKSRHVIYKITCSDSSTGKVQDILCKPLEVGFTPQNHQPCLKHLGPIFWAYVHLSYGCPAVFPAFHSLSCGFAMTISLHTHRVPLGKLDLQWTRLEHWSEVWECFPGWKPGAQGAQGLYFAWPSAPSLPNSLRVPRHPGAPADVPHHGCSRDSHGQSHFLSVEWFSEWFWNDVLMIVHICIIYIYMYMHINIYVYKYIYIYVYMYIYVYIYIYICKCIYIYIYVFMYIYIYVFMYIYVYLYIYIYVYIYVYLYIYNSFWAFSEDCEVQVSSTPMRTELICYSSLLVKIRNSWWNVHFWLVPCRVHQLQHLPLCLKSQLTKYLHIYVCVCVWICMYTFAICK